MKLDTLTEVRHLADEKWREYKEASKVNSSKLYKDAAKLYYQIKRGKKIIDITKVIKVGGLREDDSRHPKLAIAKAKNKIITCHFYNNGDIQFLNGEPGWRLKVTTRDVIIPKCFPELAGAKQWDKIALTAPVPLIPPKHLPEVLTDDYYILWEVDEWKMIAPTDPYLLKRLTRNHFIVLAGWDLTEIEKSVMNANL